MWIATSFVVTACLLMIGALVSVVAVGLVAWLFKSSRKMLWSGVGLCVYLVAVTAYFWHESRPNNIFASTFAMPLDARVSDVRGARHFYGDSGYLWLAFRAEPSVVQEIVARHSLTQAKDMPLNGEASPQLTEWMLSNPDKNVAYVGQDTHLGFMSEHEVLLYQPSSMHAFYCMRGYD